MTAKTETVTEPEVVRLTVLCPKELHEALWRARVGSPQGRKVTLSGFMVEAAQEKLARELPGKASTNGKSRKRARRVR